jgi:hypothetical protein
LKKVAIIHFSPLELYPPIQNLLIGLEKREARNTWVFTTSPEGWGHNQFHLQRADIVLVRIGKTGRLMPLVRYWNYLLFFGFTLVSLVWRRPGRILYFETISAWPAYVYKRIFNRRCEILIHYHEYTTPAEYEHGMWLTRKFHALEKWLYPHAQWISHTNAFRMDMFKNDLLPLVLKADRILPNYPPVSWQSGQSANAEPPLRVIYIGSLSLATMYTEAFAKWVIAQQGEARWDIYSNNIDSAAELFLRTLNSEWIEVKPGIPYDRLPAILNTYHVGVILYNGHNPNYIYNAPNKLFEYLACGLDVWFPTVMIGSLEYTRAGLRPAVTAIDFAELENIHADGFFAGVHRRWRPFEYFCETSLAPLLDKLIEK